MSKKTQSNTSKARGKAARKVGPTDWLEDDGGQSTKAPQLAKTPQVASEPRFNLRIDPSEGVYFENNKFNQRLAGLHAILLSEYNRVLNEAGKRGMRDEKMNEQVRLAFVGLATAKAVIELLPSADEPGNEICCDASSPREAAAYLSELTCQLTEGIFE